MAYTTGRKAGKRICKDIQSYDKYKGRFVRYAMDNSIQQQV